jgi:hypothetical protein
MNNSSKKSSQSKKTGSYKPQSSAPRLIVADVAVGTPDGSSFDLKLAIPIESASADRTFKAGKDL